jgi:signal transduction histidine kinase
MRSLRFRLTLLFTVSLLVVVGALMLAAHWHLDYELRQEKWERTHPAHPDWILHGSFTDKEVRDILGELARFWFLVSIPLVTLAVSAAYWIARGSTRPVRAINQQVARLSAKTLAQRIRAPDADPDVGELVEHFNELLIRLETSFKHLEEYAACVAHELRTPLQLMRLRIEANASCMNPALAEDLQEELSRLSNYVETSLTIARAQQGCLELQPELMPLRGFMEDTLEPFSRLATTSGRSLQWLCPGAATVWTDRRTLKQILVNLLTNALRHGQGAIRFRTRSKGMRVYLLIGNRVRIGEVTERPGLGIGLRLVRALVDQLPGAHLVLRRGTWYWVLLRLPTRGPEPLVSTPCSGKTAKLLPGYQRTGGTAQEGQGS